MCRLVASLSYRVKDVCYFSWQDLLGGETTEKIVCGLPACNVIHTGQSGNLLDHVLAELPAFDQRGVRVFCKEAFGKHAEPVKLRAKLLQMPKICRQCPTHCFVSPGRTMPYAFEAGKLELQVFSGPEVITSKAIPFTSSTSIAVRAAHPPHRPSSYNR